MSEKKNSAALFKAAFQIIVISLFLINFSASSFSQSAETSDIAFTDASKVYGSDEFVPVKFDRKGQYKGSRVYFDLDEDGNFELLTFPFLYKPWKDSLDAAQKKRTDIKAFKLSPEGSPSEIEIVVMNRAKTCVHPRKSLVADFNGDKKQDIFVICHGYDMAPFPGEKNILIKNFGASSFEIRNPIDLQGYFHAGAAGDIDMDGDIDIVLANTDVQDNFNKRNTKLTVHLNDGTGRFEMKTKSLPKKLSNLGQNGVWSLELFDVNNDGAPDLFIGGDQLTKSKSTVYLNDGTGSFGNKNAIKIPNIAEYETVYDAVYFESVIYVLRPHKDKKSYKIQSFDIKKSKAETLHSKEYSHRKGWLDWLYLYQSDGSVFLISDVQDTPNAVSPLQIKIK